MSLAMWVAIVGAAAMAGRTIQAADEAKPPAPSAWKPLMDG